jgi:hypothetical protein
MATQTKAKMGADITKWLDHQAPSWVRMANPRAMLFVGCWPEKTVAPGEAYSISWEIWSFNLTPDFGDVYGQVFLNNQLIHTTKAVSFVIANAGGDSGLQFEDAIAAPNDQALRAALYKLGPKTLELRVVATGPDANRWPLTTEFQLDVEPAFKSSADPLPSDPQGVWSFGVTPTFANWGETYDVPAVFSNQGKVGLKGDFHIHEASKDGDRVSTTTHVPFQHQFLQPGEGSVAVWHLSQRWTWFLPIVAGCFPLEKDGTGHDFTYSVVFTLQDDVGNTYPQQEMAQAKITVFVPHWKFALEVGLIVAVQLWVGASVLAAATPWPVDLFFAAIASAAALVVAALYKGALDPPEPSPRFREAVVVAPKPVPKALTSDSRLVPVATFLGVINRIAAAHTTLTEIQSRLLGARAANDSKGVALQTQSYRDVIDYLLASAAQLQAATAGLTAIENVGELFDVRATRRRLTQLRRRGVTPAMRKAWAKARLPKETASVVAAALDDPMFLRWARKGLAPSVALIAPMLMRYATARQKEAPRILDRSGDDTALRVPKDAIVQTWKPTPARTRARSPRAHR